MSADVEEFEALAWCPVCEHGAVHPFRLAKHRPVKAEIIGDDPLARHQRMLAGIFGSLEVLTLFEPLQLTDPLDAKIMRVCVQCGHEWGQR